MKTKSPKRATKSELAYIRDLERESAFDSLDQGRAKLLSPETYPEPLKKFLKRHENTLRVKLPPNVKKKLQVRSKASGKPIEKLVLTFIERGLKTGDTNSK